ncbi:unnamed protein product [Pieris macdunnoughi]|uniref:Uncharacterized protein n=1 Tax=Pieris macdunnoughi TaxID=345717 RepID=A0A821QPX5_9NEOP|nr:unnamed protein product [Pieris macdunnoughi]
MNNESCGGSVNKKDECTQTIAMRQRNALLSVLSYAVDVCSACGHDISPITMSDSAAVSFTLDLVVLLHRPGSISQTLGQSEYYQRAVETSYLIAITVMLGRRAEDEISLANSKKVLCFILNLKSSPVTSRERKTCTKSANFDLETTEAIVAQEYPRNAKRNLARSLLRIPRRRRRRGPMIYFLTRYTKCRGCEIACELRPQDIRRTMRMRRPDESSPDARNTQLRSTSVYTFIG